MGKITKPILVKVTAHLEEAGGQILKEKG